MIVYIVANKINNKVYIGQTIQEITLRKTQHLSAAKHGSKYPFHNAIRKYGAENFTWEILYRTDNLRDLNEAEEYLITEYDSCIKGYNIKHGGNNHKIPIETRQKISDASKGSQRCIEVRRRIAESRRGRRLSLETRQKISASNKGKRIGKENPMFGRTGFNHPSFGKPAPARESHPMFGNHHTRETREKISVAVKGEKHPMFGKKHSSNTREKISKSRMGRKHPMFDETIYPFYHKNYGLAFCTKYDLRGEFGLNSSATSKMANNNRLSHKGWSLATPEYLEQLRKGMGEIICAQ